MIYLSTKGSQRTADKRAQSDRGEEWTSREDMTNTVTCFI